jgi:hypothetical protein
MLFQSRTLPIAFNKKTSFLSCLLIISFSFFHLPVQASGNFHTSASDAKLSGAAVITKQVRPPTIPMYMGGNCRKRNHSRTRRYEFSENIFQ